MKSTWRKCSERHCKDKLDVLDNKCAGRLVHGLVCACGLYRHVKAGMLFGRTNNVSPDTRSCVRLRFGVASGVDLGPGFARHHDRKFLDTRGHVLLACIW